MTSEHTVIIEESQKNMRLDKALAELLPDYSRSRLQQLITQRQVKTADRVIDDAKKKVTEGEEYSVTIPPLVDAVPVAQDIPLDIIFEDDMLLVINKPAGLTVHPGAGNPDGTMVNALLHHCGDSLSGVGGVARPGIVHRIDKDTSGLLIVAKNDEAHRALAAQLEDRSLSRRYLAFVWGLPNPASGSIDAPIGRDPKNRQRMWVTEGGKEAVTHYQLVEAYGTMVSLVECQLETGRTHQIRVHMKHAGHPLIGDVTYGSRKANQLRYHDENVVAALREFPRQALHARALKFIHPKTNEAMEFECGLPEDLIKLQTTLLAVR